MKKRIFLFLLLLSFSIQGYTWGFFAHKRINRLAIFSLPPEMFSFYKFYISYLTENAVNADKRRYIIKGEACKHYIDIDVYNKFYGDSALYKMPRSWKKAVEIHTKDTLLAYGIAPWNINSMRYKLTDAFEQKNIKEILKLSADLGHYIADANVPLHTTVNYNGQLSNQLGIHAFWESRLPELFFDSYNLLVGQATYLEKPLVEAWEAVTLAHEAKDSVLVFEVKLSNQFAVDKKYTIEERNGINIRTYSRHFSSNYHKMLNGQVERRMKASIKMVADFWYTCWVDAGQPNLLKLMDKRVIKTLEKEQKEKQKKEKLLQSRPHETIGLHQNCRNPVLEKYITYYKKRVRKK